MEGVGGVGSLPYGAGQVCRTCLADAADAQTWHETVSQHGYSAILNMLVFLGFIGNEEKEEYPDTICQSCITKLMIAYQFKLTCADASATLASLPPPQELPINFDNLTDLEIIQLDHGYDLPFPNFYPEAIDELNLDSEDDVEPGPTEDAKPTQKKKLRNVKSNQRYSCNLCSRSYLRLSTLRDHLATHTDSREHLCVKCGKRFHSSAGLRQHSISHSIVRPHACTSCDKRYNALQKLKEHIRVAHTDDRYSHVCSHCGQRFTAKNSLIAHSKIHEGRKDYKCEDCPKTFTRATYLRDHRRVHTGEDRPKPYECLNKDCDRKFYTKYSRQLHMVYVHSAERDHECNICSKRFATTSGLKEHRETHLSTLVSCDLCGRELSNKRTLKRHLRTHSVERSNDIY